MTEAELAAMMPTHLMSGDDEEDTELLRRALAEARTYLQRFKWVCGIREEYFGAGIGGICAAFLFRIAAVEGVDEWLWVIVGDLPSAYLVTDEARTPRAALERYCELMTDWVRAVRKGDSMEDVFPVRAPPTLENAAALERRLEMLRSDIIPV